jgi:hypothetical protein
MKDEGLKREWKVGIKELVLRLRAEVKMEKLGLRNW